MKKNEFYKSVLFNGKLINIGIDDAGQSFFIEYVNDNGVHVIESVGSYESDYMGYIERSLGSPDLCSTNAEISCNQHLSYDNIPEECPHPHKYGYCDRCPYQDYDWYVLCQLRNLGVLNRHGDTVNQRFKHLFDDSKNTEA